MEKLDFIQHQLIDAGRRFFPVLPPDADVSQSKIYNKADLGKRPMIAAWQRTKPSEILEKGKYTKANVGIALEPTDFIVDVDWYKEIGKKSYEKLCVDFGGDIMAMSRVVVNTGGGGLHIWFKKPANVEVVKKHDDYPGIEFLSHRSFVVAPYSKHSSGGVYEFADPFMGLTDVEDAPINADGIALYDLVRRERNTSPSLGVEAAGLTDSELNISMAREYLEERAEPAVEGTRNNTLYQVACRCFNYGVSETTALELILEYYNPMCMPPMEEQEVAATVRNACSYMEEKEKGIKSLESIYSGTAGSSETEIQEADPDEWKTFLRVNRKTGIPLTNNYFNTLTVFQECPSFKNRIVYDTFEQEVKYVKPMPWSPNERIPDNGKPFGDDEMVRMRAFLNKVVGIDSAPGTTDDALKETGLANASNPVKNYIEALVWDGVPRVNTWLTDYCGVEKTEYTQAVGRKLLAAMVKRVYSPGCKFDEVVVLEGGQGARKSTLCEILGAPWSCGTHINPNDKDAFMQIRGRWVVEIPEYEKYSKVEAGHLKAFISQATDRYRDPYARRMKDHHRTSVFIATTNKEVYLHDNTGNRRYWPVRCGDVNIEGFEDVRDQLIAEAFDAHCKSPEPLYMHTEELKAAAQEQQLLRTIGDSWEEVIAEWLDNPAGGEEPIAETTSVEIWAGAFLKSPADLDKRNRNRIADVMRSLGWKTKRVRRSKTMVVAYIRPEEE